MPGNGWVGPDASAATLHRLPGLRPARRRLTAAMTTGSTDTATMTMTSTSMLCAMNGMPPSRTPTRVIAHDQPTAPTAFQSRKRR